VNVQYAAVVRLSIVLGVLASVIVYGAMSYKERGTFIQTGDAATADADDAVTMVTTTASTLAPPVLAAGVAVLQWGYYVSAGGAVVALLAAIIFFCDGRRSANDSAGRYETAATIEV